MLDMPIERLDDLLGRWATGKNVPLYWRAIQICHHPQSDWWRDFFGEWAGLFFRHYVTPAAPSQLALLSLQAQT